MKTTNHVFHFFIALLFIVTVTSCSQDNELRPPRRVLDATTFQTTSKMSHDSYASEDEATGMLQLTVLPEEAKALVVIYNQDFTSGSYYSIEGDNGLITINNIPPGNYTVLIDPQNTDYKAVEVVNVTIQGGNNTDLGSITL